MSALPPEAGNGVPAPRVAQNSAAIHPGPGQALPAASKPSPTSDIAHHLGSGLGYPPTKPPDPVKPLWYWRWELIKLGLESAAIIGAAGWLVFKFWIEEAPSHGNRADLITSLERDDRTNETCQFEYTIEFVNTSKQAVDVAATWLTVWMVDDSKKMVPVAASYMNPLRQLAGEPPVDEELRDRFVGHYPPGTRNKETLTFIVKRHPDKRILFMVDLWAAEELKGTPIANKGFDNKAARAQILKNTKPTWSDWRHEWVCDYGASPEKDEKAASATAAAAKAASAVRKSPGRTFATSVTAEPGKPGR